MFLEQEQGGNPITEAIRCFGLTEEDVDVDCREIRVEGELDLAVAGQLEEALERCEGKLMLIDLGACDFVDSTGIAVILRADRRAAGDGGRVVVHSPSHQVLRILTVTGLLDSGLVAESREAALAVAAPSA